jgi:hypothetical protein
MYLNPRMTQPMSNTSPNTSSLGIGLKYPFEEQLAVSVDRLANLSGAYKGGLILLI